MADREPEQSSSIPPPPPTTSEPAPSIPAPATTSDPAPPVPAPPPPEAWSSPPSAPPLDRLWAHTAVQLGGRARLATVAIGANMVATLIGIIAIWRERSVLVDIRDGAFFTDAELESVDAFTALAAIAFIATWIFAIVAFLRWFSQAYKNTGAWGNNEHSDGWAIGSWFVPFLNLWRPFKIAEEILQKSPAVHRTVTPPAFKIWWVAFIASNSLDRFVFRRTDETIDSYITADTVSIVSDALWLVAGFAVLRLIRSITATQDQRIASAPMT